MRDSERIFQSRRMPAIDRRRPTGKLLVALHAVGSLIGRATTLTELSSGWLDLLLGVLPARAGALAWRTEHGHGPLLFRPRDARPPELEPARIAEALASGAIVPVGGKGRFELYAPLRPPGTPAPCGFLWLSRDERPFDETDSELAVLLARLLALGAERLTVAATLQAKAAELERTQAELRAILDALPEGVAVIRGGKMVAVNAAADALVAPLLRDAALHGTKVLQLLSLQEQVAGALSGERSAWHDLQLPGAKTLETCAVPLPTGGDAVVVIRDVSERRRAEEALRRSEEQLRQAQKMEAVGRLAGGIAHDFNNLLTVIRGYAELAMDGLAPDDRMHALIDAVIGAATKASGLTGQLLAFSRRQVLQPAVLDLSAVLLDMQPLLRRLIREDIELEVRTGRVGAVRADRVQLEQVVLNLSVNARDAMPRGGRITIDCRDVDLDATGAAARGPDVQPGPYVLLAVEDTGCGMDPATLSHLFEPFFTTKEGGVGTGLGLATVHGIVKQSGGHVGARSRVGAGTRFELLFPRVAAPATAPRPAPGPSAGNGTRGGERILLVEDDPDVRAFAHDALERHGYAVIEAPDPASALVLFERARVDLLLTDVVMPGLDGPELCARLSRRRPGLRSLFMSGYVGDAHFHHADLPADVHILQKPFSPADLAREVRAALDRPPPVPQRGAGAPGGTDGRPEAVGFRGSSVHSFQPPS